MSNTVEISRKKSTHRSDSFASSGNMSSSPVEFESRDFSQVEIDSASNDDFDNTMRAFELSQMNQRQRKPRGSNFLGDFDLYTDNNDNLSI